MSKLLNNIYNRIIPKTVAKADINSLRTKGLAKSGEPHYTSDTKELFVYDGTNNVKVTMAPKFLKLTTTSTADANPTSEMKIDWDTLEIDEKKDAITHSISTDNSKITLDKDGYYRGFLSVSFYSNSSRTSPRVRIKINDTTYLTEEARNTYIRDSSGHNESSANFTFTFLAEETDYIQVTSIRGANSGTVNIAGASLTLEKL